VVGVLTVTPPSQAAPSTPVPLAESAAPRLPPGALRLGVLAPSTTISFDVTLNIPDQGSLNAFLDGLSDPSSPNYQHFLRPGQFGPRFGPSLVQAAAVADALRSAGLRPGQVSANRLSIPVTATAAAIEHAFGITLDSYRLSGGREAYANTSAPKIPANVAPLVQGVVGLNNLYPQQHLVSAAKPHASGDPLTAVPVLPKGAGSPRRTPSVTTAIGPQPCSAATNSGANTIDRFAQSYGMKLLYQQGDFGQGIRIGVVELEPNAKSDITAFEKCYGISTAVNYVKVDGGAGTGAGSGEAALDIEVLAGLAPKSVIDVYQSPNTGRGFLHDVSKFVTSDTDRVLSVSWGGCEPSDGAAFVKAFEPLFQQANAQGQTVFAAAGDNGSTDCFTGNAQDTRLSVGAPASDPYVIAVGGSTLGHHHEQIAWNDSFLGLGAGGGGVSSVWCMPAYQHQTVIPGVVNAHSSKKSSCASGYAREVPDISGWAEPPDGYSVFHNGGWVQFGIGGTSGAAPLWASIAALTDASSFCSAYGSKGATLPQNLYNAVAAHHSYIYSSTPEGVQDVTEASDDSGNIVTGGGNDYTPSGYTGGLYPTTRGYDMASGLGTPLVDGRDYANGTRSAFIPGLAQLECRQSATRLRTVAVTGVSPKAGRAGRSAAVKVHGTGFLPIGSADKAQILSGSKILATVPASCSTTVCTITVPAESARTVDIRIFAGSLWASRISRADHFTEVNAPHVSSVSPASGTHNGGTKVTIRGMNFTGVGSVKFGSRHGTKVHVVSSTEIIVVSPKAGKGTVRLTVTTAGGTSNVLTYRFT
jgi:hypothetical protein